jgi:hypothetical protein
MPKPSRVALADRPAQFRASPARGLAAGTADAPQIDPKGGDFGGGLIRGFSVIARGEALGHEMWVDALTLQQVADGINATDGVGLKMRFTHPGLSSDGMGKYLGRAKNASVVGDQVLADAHLNPTAQQSPDGDLSGYVMNLAKTDPAAFGASIVFAHDPDAEDAFIEANGGGDWFDPGDFQSPDPENVGNFPHVRVAELRAADVVDDPAANPTGLFHRGQEFAVEAEALASYALGLSSSRPQLGELGIDPDRAKQFLGRYLARHNLQLSSKELSMPKPGDQQPTEAPVDPKPEEGVDPKPETAAEPEAKDPPAEPAEPEAKPPEPPAEPAPQSDLAAQGKKFLDAFGEKGGVWFAQGKTFEEAQKLHNEQLAAENKSLKEQLAKAQTPAKPRGEADPVSFSGGGGQEQPKTPLRTQLGENLGKFAEGIVLPGGKK